jgi:hypothetical protein
MGQYMSCTGSGYSAGAATKEQALLGTDELMHLLYLSVYFGFWVLIRGSKECKKQIP